MTKTYRALVALAGIIAPLLLVLVYTIDGFLRPGYAPVRQAVSDLGRGANSWIFTVDFVVFGVLVMFFALGFPQSIGPALKRSSVNVSTVLLVLTGLASISVGVFAESIPGNPTTYGIGVAHVISAFSLFCSSAVAFLIIGWQLRKHPDWHAYGWYSFLTGFLVLFLLLLSFLVFTSIFGLVERLLIMADFAWYVVMGGRFLIQMSRPSRS